MIALDATKWCEQQMVPRMFVLNVILKCRDTISQRLEKIEQMQNRDLTLSQRKILQQANTTKTKYSWLSN